ncbi:MAG: hypothetical protein P8103_08420 [Candidatus Thiodiazotropha sp.]|jgi:hypothetical protein
MKTWFRKELGDATLAWEVLERIKHSFESVYRTAGEPEDMAIFIRHESEGRLHCQAVLYFTPSSALVAKAFEASSCQPPASADLSLLAGSHMARNLLIVSDD